jgi:hypothetical protein
LLTASLIRKKTQAETGCFSATPFPNRGLIASRCLRRSRLCGSVFCRKGAATGRLLYSRSVPVWGRAVAIYRLLQKSTFNPEEVRKIAIAYEETLKALRLTDRQNSITEIVARKIMDIAKTGELDPARIRRLTLKSLGNPNGKVG